MNGDGTQKRGSILLMTKTNTLNCLKTWGKTLSRD